LHDLGLISEYQRNDRFEVDGADAAASFLKKHNYPDNKIDVVWDAIALHTTLSIPRKKQPEIALVHIGSGIDVGMAPIELIDAKFIDEIIEHYPRHDFKNLMLDRVAKVMGRKPEMATHTFSSDVLERKVVGYQRPHFCDLMHGAGFSE